MGSLVTTWSLNRTGAGFGCFMSLQNRSGEREVLSTADKTGLKKAVLSTPEIRSVRFRAVP